MNHNHRIFILCYSRKTKLKMAKIVFVFFRARNLTNTSIFVVVLFRVDLQVCDSTTVRNLSIQNANDFILFRSNAIFASYVCTTKFVFFFANYKCTSIYSVTTKCTSNFKNSNILCIHNILFVEISKR